jgi:Ni,Fe-hydrogenase III component G
VGSLLELLKQRLESEFEDFHMQSPTRAWARIDRAHVRHVVEVLRASGGRLATMTGLEVRDGIEVNYHFCFDEDRFILTVKALASWPEPTIESVAQDLPAALWIEREIHDLLGVAFDGHPDPRRLILPDNWPEGTYPLRRDFRK